MATNNPILNFIVKHIKATEHEDDFCESWGSTKIKVIKLRHTWTINNFDSCGEEVQSATFSAGIHSEKSAWRLRLSPRKISVNNVHFNALGLGLCLVEFGHKEIIYAKYDLGIVTARGAKISIAQSNTNVRFVKGIYLGNEKLFMQDILVNERSEFLSEGKLTVLCEIIATVGSENILKTPITPQSDLTKHLEDLLESKKWSDVVLSVGGKDFQAHKAILTARSPVFQAMFEHDMQESRNNRVEITDLDEEDLCGMLRYMYTGKIEKLEESAPRLLEIAKKYAMSDLESTCEKALLENLTLENAADTFILCDMFSSIDLKQKVLDFIVAHLLDVINTAGYVAMVRSHPYLDKEVLCTLRRLRMNSN